MAPMADEAAFVEFVTTRTGALMRTAYLLTRDHHGGGPRADRPVQGCDGLGAHRGRAGALGPADPLHGEHLLVQTAQVSRDDRWFASGSGHGVLGVVQTASGVEGGWVVETRGPRRLLDSTTEILAWTASDQLLVLVHPRSGPSTFARTVSW